MGFATIVSGGTDGRYTVSLDYGSATKAALLNALSVLLAKLDTDIGNAQADETAANAEEDAQAEVYLAAVDAFIAQHGQGFAPGAPRPDDSAVRFALQVLRQLQIAHQPLRAKLVALKFERAQALKRITYWNTFSATETRQVWCTDYTDDRAAGAVVATMDIPGESNLLILAPGARAWTPADGQLVAREIMSPEQAFFNAAILPGWQIDAPTYRWGTVTGINLDANTLDVSLAPATSSAQSLNVNRETALAAVPVNYMETGAVVFEVDDRVVVQFQGQDWANPRVMGFVDNPRPVGNWQAVWGQWIENIGVNFYTAVGFRVRPGGDFTFDDIYTAARAGGVTADYRVDRGSWLPLTTLVQTSNVVFLVELPGFDAGLLAMTPSFGWGAGCNFVAWDDMGFSPGAIVEVRMFWAGDLILNAAIRVHEETEVPIAIIGQLTNEFLEVGLGFPVIPLVRLSYTLFQTSGD